MKLFVLLIWLSSAFGDELPRYTVTSAADPTPGPMYTATPAEGGYAFRLPARRRVQRVVIEHQDLTAIRFFAKTGDRWRAIKTVRVAGESPLRTALNAITDAILIRTEPATSGRLRHCRFDVAASQPGSSIPLVKPPFVK